MGFAGTALGGEASGRRELARPHACRLFPWIGVCTANCGSSRNAWPSARRSGSLLPGLPHTPTLPSGANFGRLGSHTAMAPLYCSQRQLAAAYSPLSTRKAAQPLPHSLGRPCNRAANAISRQHTLVVRATAEEVMAEQATNGSMEVDRLLGKSRATKAVHGGERAGRPRVSGEGARARRRRRRRWRLQSRLQRLAAPAAAAAAPWRALAVSAAQGHAGLQGLALPARGLGPPAARPAGRQPPPSTDLRSRMPRRRRRLADDANSADGDLHLPGHGGADCLPGGPLRILRVRCACPVTAPTVCYFLHCPCCRCSTR